MKFPGLDQFFTKLKRLRRSKPLVSENVSNSSDVKSTQEKPFLEEDQPSDFAQTTKTQYLLTQLIVLTILIIGLILLIAAYPTLRQAWINRNIAKIPTAHPSQTASLTPSPTITSTPTRTLRDTLTPTISLTPSLTLTPSITPTPPGPPTLTPARPVANDQVYKLPPWTAEQADYLIQLMEDYPNTLTRTVRREDDSGYWSAFSYATVAIREALLQFPDDPRVTTWQWKLAYNLVRTGEEEAGAVYAQIIASSLNQGLVSLDGLRSWFKIMEPRLNLYVIEIDPPTGYFNAYLLQIEGPGSAFLWLLESSSAYEVYSLFVNYNFSHPISSRALLADLNNDKFDEVIFYQETQEGIFELNTPVIYDLSKVPSTKLSYQPGSDRFFIGMDYKNRWIIDEQENAADNLVFEVTIFDACPTIIRFDYRWNGESLERFHESFAVSPQTDLLIFCNMMIHHASDFWGPKATVSIMENLLPGWPPTKKEDKTGLTPIEVANLLDEFRFYLGLNYGFLGNITEAKSYLSLVGEPPSNKNSTWYSIAQVFLDSYHAPQDIYLACIRTNVCNANAAMSYLVNGLPKEAHQDVIAYLVKLGITPIASGYFDFDGDGSKDRWMTLRHRPLESIELWAFLNTPAAPRGFFITTIETIHPELSYVDENRVPPLVKIGANRQFILSKLRNGSTPSITWIPAEKILPNRFIRTLQEAEKNLLSGTNPKEIQQILQNLEKDPGLLCKASWSCDRYYYFLGLSSELAKDKQAAIKSYLQLWRDYIRSPFTTFARLKLEGIALAVSTPSTPTPSPTPTFYPTTTPGTPYPPYPYPYPTEEYPYPTTYP